MHILCVHVNKQVHVLVCMVMVERWSLSELTVCGVLYWWHYWVTVHAPARHEVTQLRYAVKSISYSVLIEFTI